MRIHLNRSVLFIVLCATGCLEPYSSPDIQGVEDMLVVDGFINTSARSATVNLTYSIPLDSSAAASPVSNAIVTIEKDDGTQYPLSQSDNGAYEITNTSFEQDATYRLHINASGDEYVSDNIELTQTPDIDSVTWKADDDGLIMMVNTHDPTSNARYYRWDYQETWQYVASFFSNYMLVNGEALDRRVEDRIYMCWSNDFSKNVLVGNSDRLVDDVIRDFPLTHVMGNSVKLSSRYSILVRQRALTKEAYEFWSELQRTSEGVGGLFDPQPYEVLGNIHSVNGDKIALGYFGGGEVKEKRLFIELRDMPFRIANMREPAPCGEEFINSALIADLPFLPSNIILIEAIYVRGIGIVGYTYADRFCVDCQRQGGSLQQPEFW